MPLNVPTRHNDKLRALVAAIDADEELAQWWKCANVNVVDRQGMTDHGEVHIRIVANAALKLLRLLSDAGIQSSIERTYEMTAEDAPELAAGVADEQAIKELSTLAMRCGGCGAKVGSTVLSRVVQRLPQQQQRDDVVIGLDAPDDAAVYRVPEGKLLVQSVDYFRSFIDDAYVFGQIAANHALGDLFAMGAEPQSVLAIATVPYGRERIVEETLFDVMMGALAVTNATGAVLAGGHCGSADQTSSGQLAWRITSAVTDSSMERRSPPSP